MKNYGYTFSFASRGSPKRMRGEQVFRTKKEINAHVKKLQKTSKVWGVVNIRPVKATAKEYSKFIKRK